MKRSSTFRLFGTPSKQTVPWIHSCFANDEPHGDIADRANVFAEAYRSQALHRVLNSHARQNKRERRRWRKCEHCGEYIPKERLAAWPRATRCIKCQKQFEQALPNHRRLVCT